MEAHNKHHTKLLVAKSLFQMLESMVNARKQESMNEFFTYCRFDEKCHDTLKQFVSVLNNLGQNKMRRAIQQWYKKTFKPVETLIQIEEAAEKFKRDKMIAKYWTKWRNRYALNEDFYSTKNKAIQIIWQWKVADCRKEMMRAFNIWRDLKVRTALKERTIKHLMWVRFNN